MTTSTADSARKEKIMNVFMRTTVAVVLAGAVGVGMSSCSLFSPTPVETVTANPSAPPMPSSFETISGNEIHLKMGDFFEVSVPPGDVTAWKAEFSEEGIVTFVPGSKDGSTIWKPGFSPTTPGKTNVKLTNGTESVSFTIVVDLATGAPTP
jgi:hypothetical protein